MLILVDANILIYSTDPASPFHPDSVRATNELRRRGDMPCIVPQSLYEFWVVATRPIDKRGLGLTPSQAQAELVTIKRFFPFMADTPAIYQEWERLIALHSVSGKNGHDTRYVAAMIVHGITHLLTDNKNDFKRFTTITVFSPSEI
jgi:predicted nucleic acid-binding protein